MAEYVVLIVGNADRWWTSMGLKERKDCYAEYAHFGEEVARRGRHDLDDLLECCTIIAAVGDGIEVRRTVDPAERPS